MMNRVHLECVFVFGEGSQMTAVILAGPVKKAKFLELSQKKYHIISCHNSNKIMFALQISSLFLRFHCPVALVACHSAPNDVAFVAAAFPTINLFADPHYPPHTVPHQL